MSITILTGLQTEAAIVRGRGFNVLCGSDDRDNLDTRVPADCTGIVSFGCGGGLSHFLELGYTVVASRVETGTQTFLTDPKWGKAIIDRLHPQVWVAWVRVFSNLAEPTLTVAERKAVLTRTKAWMADQESFAVAAFAQRRGVPFVVIRSASDTASTNLSPLVATALNTDGSVNVWNVLSGLSQDPSQVFSLIGSSLGFNKAAASLKMIADALGPSFAKP